MTSHTESLNTIEPFLINYATPRTSSPDIPGYYSNHLEMWVIDKGNQVEPLIEKCSSLARVVTKTMTQQETDDEESSAMGLPDLMTKTDTKREQDDQCLLSVLNLVTKTENKPERDDVHSEITSLFI